MANSVKRKFQKEEKKKSRTVHAQDELNKKWEEDADNYYSAVSQDSEEKASKYVIEFQKEVEKKEKEKSEEALHILNKSRRLFNDKDYIIKIARELYKVSKTIDFPRGYEWTVRIIDKKKIDLIFSKKGRVYGQGLDLSFDPKYDLHAVKVLATRAENTVDKLEGRLASQQNGLVGLDGKPLRKK